jgi:hypothetical protein
MPPRSGILSRPPPFLPHLVLRRSEFDMGLGKKKDREVYDDDEDGDQDNV